MQVEIHHEKMAPSVKSHKFVTIAAKCQLFERGLFWISLGWWGIFVQDPLIETLVSHLIKVPEAHESFSIATDIKRKIWV